MHNDVIELLRTIYPKQDWIDNIIMNHDLRNKLSQHSNSSKSNVSNIEIKGDPHNSEYKREYYYRDPWTGEKVRGKLYNKLSEPNRKKSKSKIKKKKSKSKKSKPKYRFF